MKYHAGEEEEKGEEGDEKREGTEGRREGRITKKGFTKRPLPNRRRNKAGGKDGERRKKREKLEIRIRGKGLSKKGPCRSYQLLGGKKGRKEGGERKPKQRE